MALLQLKNEDGDAIGYLQTDANERIGVNNLLHVVEEAAVGAPSGSLATGAWRTRPFNKVLHNTIQSAALSLGRITLPAGVYYCDGHAPAYRVSAHMTRLYNITSANVLLLGSSANTRPDNYVENSSFIYGVFELAEEAEIELQHTALVSNTTNGLGGGADGVNTARFADLKIWRICDVEES